MSSGYKKVFMNEIDCEDTVIEELNKKHAIVHIEHFYILTEKKHPFYPHVDFVLESKQSFLNTYENQFCTDKNNKRMTKAQLWLKHPNRRQYQGITFDPCLESCEKKGYYNIWKGFASKSIEGNCQLFKDFVKEVICSENEENYLYVWKWMAHIVQKPDKIAPGIILMGSNLFWKEIFAKAFGSLFGRHFLHLYNLKHLTATSNLHIKDSVLIFTDTLILDENIKELEKLKAMAAEEFVKIQLKNKKSILIRNFRHFILACEKNCPVYLDADDSRFLALKVKEKKIGTYPDFIELIRQHMNGGHEALLYELLHEDISSFNPMQLPKNQGNHE